MARRNAEIVLLLTDIVGSTPRWEEDDAGMSMLVARHDELVAAAVADADGVLVKHRGEGDSTFSVFSSSASAMRAAVQAQRALCELDLEVRMAIHRGPAHERDGDYFGTTVNRAARLRSVATGGEILVSAVAAGRDDAVPPDGARLVDLGRMPLRGVSELEHVFRLEHPDLRRMPRRVARPPMAAVLSSRASVFVGRVSELAMLTREWEVARAGERRVALVAGEPGIGKTALVARLAHGVSAEGGAVLVGRCEEGSATPYLPFVEALGDAAPWLRGEGVFREGDPETQRFRLFEQTSEALDRIASQWPVLLVLDDIHWADAPSLMLLRHIARRASNAPILIVCAYRSSEVMNTPHLVDLLANFTRDVSHSRVALRGLTTADVAAFVQRVDVSADAARVEFAEDLADATRGNPFFIEQVLSHIAEAHVGRSASTRAASWKDFGVPDQVREVIASRLSRLSGDTTALLRAAAVIGNAWDFDTTVSAAGLEDDAAVAAVEEALEARLVTSLDEDRPSFGFVHALVRETLYGTLSAPRRQRLHLRVADALQNRTEGPSDRFAPLVAQHLRAAGGAADPDILATWLIRAGDQASRVFAFEDALRFWSDAADVLRRAPGSGRNVELGRLLERIGSLVFATGTAPERGVRALDEALEISDEVGDTERVARLHSRLGATYSLSDHGERVDIPRALEHLARAAPLLGKRTDRAGGYFLITYGNALMRALRLDEAHEASARALEIADGIGDQALWANAGVLHGWCLFEEGHLRAGPALVERAYEAGKQSGVVLMQFLAAWNRSNCAVMTDDPSTSLAWCMRDLEDRKLLQARGSAETLIRQAARALFELGRTDDRRALLTKFEMSDPLADTSTFGSGIGARVAPYWQVIQDTGDRWAGGWLMTGFIEASDPAVRRTDPDRCRTIIEWATAGKARVVEVLARSRAAIADIRTGACDDARPHLERARELMSDGQDWAYLTGRIDYADALRYVFIGDETRAADAVHNALQCWERAGLAWRQVQANLLLDRVGDTGASERATAILERCAAPPALRNYLLPW